MFKDETILLFISITIIIIYLINNNNFNHSDTQWKIWKADVLSVSLWYLNQTFMFYIK